MVAVGAVGHCRGASAHRDWPACATFACRGGAAVLDALRAARRADALHLVRDGESRRLGQPEPAAVQSALPAVAARWLASRARPLGRADLRWRADAAGRLRHGRLDHALAAALPRPGQHALDRRPAAAARGALRRPETPLILPSPPATEHD